MPAGILADLVSNFLYVPVDVVVQRIQIGIYKGPLGISKNTSITQF